MSVPAKDYRSIAESLITIGATNKDVNSTVFAEDIKKLVEGLFSEADQSNNPEQFLQTFTLQISEVSRNHGIRFPREFTLLIKQFLYFDHYISLLAPNLEIFSDNRINLLN